ncbi:VOC family protein [Haloarcula nitratireducens]|uniref:VOC family protein n=1 Tax=Haloarcula nitratireducens TaxID=2487749 RepID=A0AAW4PIM3_9EURY|nr:VOC family protein [Halomicroarcula nitratireducens]MBX0297326.1 VOC family protein [Halomicroarcula nitratireducens]
MSSDVLPRETRIGRTALRVNDLEEISGFYRDVVGLSVLRHSDTGAVLGVEDTPLLVLEGAENALERHGSSAGLFHNAFRVPSREALGDALARIRNHWQLGGASDHGVSEALYLTDPEGNGIEIYRDYPREDWPRGDDGRVRMGTYPLDLDPVEAAAAGEAGLPTGTDVGHVHLEVSSLETFSDFYVDTIGFEVQTEMSAALFVGAGGYHHHVGANTWNHRSGPVGGRGLSWFEVVLPDAAALGELEDRTADSPYTVTETDDGISVMGPDDIEVRFRART